MDEIKSKPKLAEDESLDFENKPEGTGLEVSFQKPKENIFKIEKETSKEIIVSEKDAAYNKILAKIKTPAGDEDAVQEEVKVDAEKFFDQTDAESQVQYLIDIAFNKNIVHAVKVARHLEDNYVLDMFHDKMLADELHDALVQKGLIKEI